MESRKKTVKLGSKQESDICLSCGECCKRYWITVLPDEAKKIARLSGKPLADFLNDYCVLSVKLFQKSTPGVLTYPTAFFPKSVYLLLKSELGFVPESFFVVPQVVLKRTNKTTFSFFGNKSKKESRTACIYINADNSCGIYPSRPAPCKLFPFIAMPDYREQYPFCELFKKTSKDFSIESKIYYKKVQQYFKDVDESGFEGVWRHSPKKGFLFLGEKQIGEISVQELLQLTMQKN